MQKNLNFKQLSGLDASSGINSIISRPSTKFENRGRALGHEIVDLVYTKL